LEEGKNVLKDKVVKTLNRPKIKKKEDKKTIKAIDKIQRQKRLSSDEFRKVYETLWTEGPRVKYQSPDAWRRLGESANS